jgi:hypothetical protein
MSLSFFVGNLHRAWNNGGILGYSNDGKTLTKDMEIWEYRSEIGLGNLRTLIVGIEEPVEYACVLTTSLNHLHGWKSQGIRCANWPNIASCPDISLIPFFVDQLDESPASRDAHASRTGELTGR